MKKIKSLLLAVTMLAAMLTPSFAYTYESETAEDIAGASSWAKEEIELANDAGLITEHTSMNLRASINREQFAELAVNLVEKVSGQTIWPADVNTFTDCTSEVVLKAYTAGIVSGTSETTFSPEDLLTREQLAAMLYRAWDYLYRVADVEISEQDQGLDGYADVEEVSGWAYHALDILTHADILKGADGKLMPKADCTIEQSILLTYRLYDLYLAR